jgi:hypothetical protein
MKIWKEFGSSHSGNVSVIGTFSDPKDAKAALEMIEDFTLGEWEERHASVDEFLEIWSEKFHPDVKYTSIYQTDYSLGIDNTPNIELVNNRIEISRLRTSNVGGIIKLMLFAGAKTANVSNNK